MAYCRWSDNNGYCDVYVNGDLKRGWTTRVATKRHPEGRPLDDLNTIKKHRGDPRKALEKSIEARTACEAWEKENPKIPIAHKDAGAKFKHSTPSECADNLERLKSEGFGIPQHTIDQLREEALWYETWGNGLPEGSQ
ncbi:hypothetical protein [uncultured Ruegeria sp.]|uniref:hypothetical protein n=1 Tax=uncultured Ruegeria sp. TaxID=259304 RepID=UPI00260946F5|nr:hypothetical protein [uncultured Ruegeria sp.]